MTIQRQVSCITIFLNEETFLEEAIASVIAQTYQHWQLLLVDDGSTDGSSAIAQKYAQQYPEKIRYLEHPNHQNRGMSTSRNLGVEMASGDYIAFLDADDVWLPQKLEEQVKCLESYPQAAMLYGKALYWRSWSKSASTSQDYFSNLGAKPNTLVYPPHLLTQFLRSKGGPTTSSILVRRQIFETIGAFEPDFRGMCEDQVFYSKVFLNAPVLVSDNYWSQYRQHFNSCAAVTLRNPGQDFKAWEQYLNWLENYLAKINRSNGEVKQLVQAELAYYRDPKLRRRAAFFNYWKRHLKRLLEVIIQQPLLNKLYYYQRLFLQRNWIK